MRVSDVGALRRGRFLAGVLLRDLPIYTAGLLRRGEAYLAIRNRAERLEPAPTGSGYRCDWQWTSVLHAPRHLPRLGLSLLRRALAEHPIRRQARPEQITEAPAISFLIGHRGAARLPHLLATLESIAGQRNVDIECLVIEQDEQARLPGHLPDWVRHVHTPPPSPNMPYCRAWAFNVGARLAQGRMLVLHDNDMLVPADYAARILDLGLQGWEAINLKRFIFYLSESHSGEVFAGTADLCDKAPEAIVQNLEAGGSIAIGRGAYQRIGGMDEGFIGWGGEDNEFWERCQTLRVWPYGALPLVHLWHPAQPGKYQADNLTLKRFQDLSNIPPQHRIERLRQRPAGMLTGPTEYAPGLHSTPTTCPLTPAPELLTPDIFS